MTLRQYWLSEHSLEKNRMKHGREGWVIKSGPSWIINRMQRTTAGVWWLSNSMMLVVPTDRWWLSNRESDSEDRKQAREVIGAWYLSLSGHDKARFEKSTPAWLRENKL